MKAIFKTFVVFTLAEHFVPVWAMFGGAPQQVVAKKSAAKQAAAQQVVAKASANAAQQVVAKEVAAQLVEGLSLADLQNFAERHNFQDVVDMLSNLPDLFKGSQHAQGDEALQAIRRKTAQEIIWSARRMLGGKKAADKKTASQQAVAKEAEAYGAIAAEILEAESPLRLEKHALPGPPGPVPASGR